MITIMNKKLINLLFIVCLLVASFGFVLLNNQNNGLCFSDYFLGVYDVSCIENFSKVGSAIFYSMTAFSIVLFLLIIFPATRYYWWKKTRIYLIFALLIGISYEEPRGWNDLFFPQPETMYLWLSIGFVAISVISIVVALIVQKNRKSIPEIEPSKKL